MASQWGGSIPPPPGVEVNLVDPPSQLPNNIALHTVCLTLATTLVAIRVYTRLGITKARLGLDDYFCIISWALSITFSALLIKSYTYGIGRNMWDEPAAWLTDALKWFTIASLVYLWLTCCIKLAFLFLFYRLFSLHPAMRYWIIGGIIFITSLNIALFFGTLFSCLPVEKSWNSTLPGHCIDPIILPYLSGASSSAMDIFILILPIPPLWALNMSLAKRLKVLAVFCVGLFACVASLVRLGKTPVLRSSLNSTWNISTIAVWATIEVNVGIICSCLMLMPAFLDHHLPESVKSYASRIWSTTIQSLTFRRSRATSKSDSPSTGNVQHWKGYAQKIESNSQNNIQMHEVSQAV